MFVSDIPFGPRILNRKLDRDVHWALLCLLFLAVPICFPIYTINKAGDPQIRCSLLCHPHSYSECREGVRAPVTEKVWYDHSRMTMCAQEVSQRLEENVVT